MAGLVALALFLPVLLRGVNYLQRMWVGAEGRLAAITVDGERPIGPLPRPWRAIAQGGEDLNTFLDGNEEKVKALGVEYIRIDHIYDRFDVVSGDGNGVKLDWSRLDRLVDKIATAGAKPFFSLSYMPAEIASGDEVSEPRDWGKWQEIVQKTIEYYSGEKGLEGVYYEVWNEPDLFGKWTIGRRKDYNRLYYYSALGASQAKGVKDFKLGGPATTELYKNWVDEFLPYVLEKRLRLDFLSWHRYDSDEGKYIADMDNADYWLERHPYFSQVEKIISETGISSEPGGKNDTRTGAAHLILVARDLMSRVKYGFNFSLTGKWGMLGKPREQALAMLAKLEGNRLPLTGEGTWVKAIAAGDDSRVQVIVVNYDPKERHSEVVPVSFVNLKNQRFIMKETFLSGESRQEEVATNGAVWQKEIPMTPNSAVLLELSAMPEGL